MRIFVMSSTRFKPYSDSREVTIFTTSVSYENIYNHVMRMLIDEDCFLTYASQSGAYYLMSQNLIIHQIVHKSTFNLIRRFNKAAFIKNEESRWVIK